MFIYLISSSDSQCFVSKLNEYNTGNKLKILVPILHLKLNLIILAKLNKYYDKEVEI